MSEKKEFPLKEDEAFFEDIKRRMNKAGNYEELHEIMMEFRARSVVRKSFPVGWNKVIEDLSFHIASHNNWIQT